MFGVQTPVGFGNLPTTASPPNYTGSYMSFGTPTAPIGGAGQPYFQKGQDILGTQLGGSNYDSILKNIQSQGDLYNKQQTSQAQALALARGYAGSSTEAFGVQQAASQANQATLNAQNQTLLQQAQNEAQAQQQAAAGYFDQNASMNNLDFSNRYLALQQKLGQQGLDIAQQNISANRDIAQQQSRNSLISSGASIFAPYLMNGLNSGGGGGGLFSAFGGGGGAAGAAGYAGAPAGASSSFFPGGLGSAGAAGGTGMTGPGGVALGAGGTGFFGSMGAVPGLAALYGGGQLAMGAANMGQNAFSSYGKTAGSAGSVLGSPLGAQLNAAKSIFGGGNVVSNVGNKVSSAASSVGNAVSSVFPF